MSRAAALPQWTVRWPVLRVGAGGWLPANQLGRQAQLAAAVDVVEQRVPPGGAVRADVRDPETVAGREVVERQQRMRRAPLVDDDIGVIGHLPQYAVTRRTAGPDDDVRFSDGARRAPRQRIRNVWAHGNESDLSGTHMVYCVGVPVGCLLNDSSGLLSY